MIASQADVEIAGGACLVSETQFARDAALEQEAGGRVGFADSFQRAKERHRSDALAYAAHAEAVGFGVSRYEPAEVLLGLRPPLGRPRLLRFGAHRVGTVSGSNPISRMSSS